MGRFCLSWRNILKVLAIYSLLFAAQTASAFSANRVFFEQLGDGRFRVTVSYTVPALKEFREVRTDFRKKREAEDYYWKMVKGADFYLSDPKTARYEQPPLQPRPW